MNIFPLNIYIPKTAPKIFTMPEGHVSGVTHKVTSTPTKRLLDNPDLSSEASINNTQDDCSLHHDCAHFVDVCA